MLDIVKIGRDLDFRITRNKDKILIEMDARNNEGKFFIGHASISQIARTILMNRREPIL